MLHRLCGLNYTEAMQDLPPIPGILAPDPGSDRLLWGPLAGRVRWQPMDEWKHGIALVARGDLAARGLPLPESRIVHDQPRIRAAITALPALAVDPTLLAALSAAGGRICEVHYTRHTDTLTLTARGWGVPAVSLSELVTDLLPGGSLEAIDRLIGAATGGQLGELAVRGADFVAKHVDRRLTDPSALAADRSLQALLAELDEAVCPGLGDPTLRFAASWEDDLAPGTPAAQAAARAATADILAGRLGAVRVGGQRFAIHHRPATVAAGMSVPAAVIARR